MKFSFKEFKIFLAGYIYFVFISFAISLSKEFFSLSYLGELRNLKLFNSFKISSYFKVFILFLSSVIFNIFSSRYGSKFFFNISSLRKYFAVLNKMFIFSSLLQICSTISFAMSLFKRGVGLIYGFNKSVQIKNWNNPVFFIHVIGLVNIFLVN